jgi:glutaredoxin 3
MVKVYSISNCPWCAKVKKYLKVNNVEFEEHNVEENDADRDELYKISGDLIVPVTTIDGKNYVLSFDKAKLDTLLGL